MNLPQVMHAFVSCLKDVVLIILRQSIRLKWKKALKIQRENVEYNYWHYLNKINTLIIYINYLRYINQRSTKIIDNNILHTNTLRYLYG